MGNWFAAKMAEQQGQQAQRPLMYQPNGQVPSQMYQQAPVYQQPGQPQYYQPQPQYAPQQGQQLDPNGFPMNEQGFWMAASTWTGGKGHQQEREPCPECGSTLFFSRGGAQGSRLVNSRTGEMVSVAPQCSNCGWSTAVPLQTGVGGGVAA